MDHLLLKVRSELRAYLPGYRKCDIYITPDLLFLPQGVKMPCIGIKDGGVERKYLTNHIVELTLSVRFALFHELYKKEEAIIDTLRGGAAICELLEDNTLEILGAIAAEIVKDPPTSFWLGPKKEMFMRKELVVDYTIERQRI